MQYTANAPNKIETHLKVSQVLDGDSIKVVSIFSKKEKEIRLYGLDAPEVKNCRKLREVEKKSQIAGELLIMLGKISTQFVLKYAPPGTNVTIITENANQKDFYGRQLAYLILPSGECLNEILIREGYAKTENEYYCSKLKEFQELNFIAMKSKFGLYNYVKRW
jgi:micrococcal nuclease